MNWLINTFTASIGKKLVMACTGLVFCMFLFVHLVGNLMVYRGSEAFNSYSAHLHSFGIAINVIEICLAGLALFHICFGAWLFYENWRARPVGYVMKKNAGGRTISSATMPYTGLYLLVFIIIHLINFHFADRTGLSLFQLVSRAFSNPWTVAFYVFSMVVAAFHVRHGLWSAFQSLGANHPKYMPFIRKASVVFAIVVGIGFGSIPLFFMSGI